MKKYTIDFLGIGVQKAGTSWLQQNLIEHSNIWMPPRKEIHYFDRAISYPSPSFLATSNPLVRLVSKKSHNVEFRKKVKKELQEIWKSKNKLFWYLHYFFSYYNNNWYNKLFKEGANKVSGEITPAYSLLKLEDIQSIYKLYPNLKIILILRNPIERAWSHVRFHMKLNKFSKESSLNEIIDFINSPKQIERSDYLNILKRWQSVFPKNQIHVCFYDEISQNPEQVIANVFTFLELPPQTIPKESIERKVNVSAVKEIPKEIEVYLAKKYYEDIKQLNIMFSSHTKKWLENTEKILSQR